MASASDGNGRPDGSANRNHDGRPWHEQTAVHGFVLEPDREMTYQTGYTLHSYTLRKEDEGWLLVVRVNAKNGGRLVTFIKTASIYHCFELWYQAMTTNGFKLKWHPDKFA